MALELYDASLVLVILQSVISEKSFGLRMKLPVQLVTICVHHVSVEAKRVFYVERGCWLERIDF